MSAIVFSRKVEREMEDLKREEAISNFHYELDSVVADEYFMSVKKEVVSTLTAL